jgi:hypothetical protein
MKVDSLRKERQFSRRGKANLFAFLEYKGWAIVHDNGGGGDPPGAKGRNVRGGKCLSYSPSFLNNRFWSFWKQIMNDNRPTHFIVASSNHFQVNFSSFRLP